MQLPGTQLCALLALRHSHARSHHVCRSPCVSDPTHGPDCRCSPPRRPYISGIDSSNIRHGSGVYGSASYADYNDATDCPEPYDPAMPASATAAGVRPYGLSHGPHSATMGDDGFSDDEDSCLSEAPATNLSEDQIQKMIQAQVARLNARLNELDEELAQEEEEAEGEEEEAQVERERARQKQAQQEEREKLAAAAVAPAGAASSRPTHSRPSAGSGSFGGSSGAGTGSLSHRPSFLTAAAAATAATAVGGAVAASGEPESPLDGLDIDLDDE